MSLERKLKTALDETRLLILGAQVLFGFQFNGVFQELFENLSPSSRYLQCGGLLLITLTIGLTAGGALLLLALCAWYALEFLMRRDDLMGKKEPEKPTPLSTKVDQLL